jgi:hypothetical protein
MSRRVLLAVAAALALGTAACASSGTEPAASSSPVSSAPGSPTASADMSSSAAECHAADDLRASITALGQVDIVKQGTNAVQQSFAQVESALAALAAAAKGQHGPQLQQVQADATAVQAALDQAKAGPSASTLGALATAVHTLIQDARTLLAAVGATC